jgi:hypothetical protein
MNALRHAAVALIFTGLLVAAAIGCGDNTIQITACGTPTLSERAADGGPDPCHCDPPPSLGIMACACLLGDQQDIDAYQSCMFLYTGEEDAGDGTGAH